MTPYIIFRIIIALVLGVVLYMIDRWSGTGLYRWWFGMTHEHPLPADVHRGFIHNRATRNRVVFATILASIITLLAVMYGSYNALLELGLWLVSIPVIVMAFMFAPPFAGLWGKREGVYTAVDKWERGEIDITDQIKLKSTELAAGVRKVVSPVAEQPVSKPVSASANTAADQPAQVQPIDEKPQPDPEPDPQEMVNKFINRGQS